MNIKKLVVSAVISVVTIGVTTIPAFAVTGPLQNMIDYYTSYAPTFARSATPFTLGVTTQTDNPDGSVTVNINSATGYADSGFVIYDGKLGDLNNFSLTGTGDEYGLNLWFDVDNDGEYFTWSGMLLSVLGADKYILGPSSIGGAMSITNSSQFTSLIPGGGNYTLAQLQLGSAPGITSNTNIAIWVGVCCEGTKSATISLVVPSPTSKDQCKKDGWKAFSNPSFKNQGDCVSFVQSNPHAIGNKSK